MIKQYRLYSRIRGWENIGPDIPDEKYFITSIINSCQNLDSLIGQSGKYIYTKIQNHTNLYNQKKDSSIKKLLELSKIYPHFYLYQHNIRFGSYTLL